MPIPRHQAGHHARAFRKGAYERFYPPDLVVDARDEIVLDQDRDYGRSFRRSLVLDYFLRPLLFALRAFRGLELLSIGPRAVVARYGTLRVNAAR